MGDKSWFYTVVGQLSAAANVHQRPELRDETHRACKLAMVEHDKERAVIEAAKALHAAMIQSYDGEPVPLAVMVEFKTAVEALQEVEQ